MTTQKPVFGKKTSGAASRRTTRPAQSQALSSQAEAFLQREREAAGDRAPSGGGIPFPSEDNSTVGGKPVWGRRVIARIVDELLVWGLVYAGSPADDPGESLTRTVFSREFHGGNARILG